MARLAILAILFAAVAAAKTCEINTLNVSYPAPVVAAGWEYRLVATNLTRPRSILFDKDGGLLVLDSGVGVVRLELQDEGETCVSVKKKTILVENSDLNHGIQLSEDGKTLYASSSNEVYSWPYSTTSLDSDSRTTLVTNMSNSDHTTRTILLSGSNIIVSRGSDSNSDTDAEDLTSGHAQIRRFSLSNKTTANFLDGELLGWGLRNSVGLAEDPIHGGIWSVENSVDQLMRDGVDIHTNNPGEELNFHGFSNGSLGPLSEMGRNYGYPVCYALWETKGFPDLRGLKTGDQFPGGNSTEDCSTYEAPMVTFQAHMAPLDIKFNSNGKSAFISFHGSWNRQEPVGYKISDIAFSDGMPLYSSSSRDALIDVISSPDLSKCPGECFRPVGLAWDKDGRVWFSSDSTGEIFVLSDISQAEGTDNSGTGLFVSQAVVTVGAVVVGLLLA